MVVADVDLWDAFGNPKVGKSYSLTDNAGVTMVINYHEHQPVSPGLSGQFRFEYLGIRSTIMDLQMIGLDIFATEELRKLHSDLSSAEIAIEGNCNSGYDINLAWGDIGDFQMVNIETFNLSGINPGVESHERGSGGIYVRAIPGGQMTTLHDEPQVQVRRRGIHAQCNQINCDMSFVAPGQERLNMS